MYFCDKNMSWRKINENAPQPTLLANSFLHIKRCSKIISVLIIINADWCGMSMNGSSACLMDVIMNKQILRISHGGNRNAFLLSWCRSSPTPPSQFCVGSIKKLSHHRVESLFPGHQPNICPLITFGFLSYFLKSGSWTLRCCLDL